jgi:cellulose synthase/poly-beta-1,6-N-acetylglucosamine synthase-like glycosyltransferase
MKRVATEKAWDLMTDESYKPNVSVIVPTYNEAINIIGKLENLSELDYPKDKLEVIVVDSASTDGTANIVRQYLKKNSLPFKIFLLEEIYRGGKVQALNHALKYASSNIIATSDADCTWTPDSLRNAVKYISDPSVAAVCGQEVFTHHYQSSAIRTENLYRVIFNYIRLGESKIDSTITFEGGLALYKREILSKFNGDCDDSQSALDLVQKGFRTVQVPDAFFISPFPSDWSRKSSKKIRRAQHLVEVFWRCARLDIDRRLRLHPWISRVNVFLYIINPFLFFFLTITVITVLFRFPLLFFLLPLVFVPKARDLIALYVSNNFYLLIAIFQEIRGHKQIVWNK